MERHWRHRRDGSVSAADAARKVAGYIDINPTWGQLLPTLLMVFENANAKGRAEALNELKRMAIIADRFVASQGMSK